MINLALEKLSDQTKVYISSEKEFILSGITLKFSAASKLINATCHIPTFQFDALPAPEKEVAWMITPPIGRRWALEPTVKWKRRTDAEIHRIQIMQEDVGKLALNWDTARLWRVVSGSTSRGGAPGWIEAGFLKYIWEAPTIKEPILLLTIYDKVILKDALIHVKPEYGRWVQAAKWEESVYTLLSDVPKLQIIRHYLESDQIDRALLLLDEMIDE